MTGVITSESQAIIALARALRVRGGLHERGTRGRRRRHA
jgi:hypothetical protein